MYYSEADFSMSGHVVNPYPTTDKSYIHDLHASLLSNGVPHC